LPRTRSSNRFTIHLRQLIDFFWPPKNVRRDGRKNPDALAADYFEAGEWEQLCPERPKVLSKAIREKVGWGVAHLTYGRAWSKPEDKEWNVLELGHALLPAVRAFVENVEPGKLDPEHIERMKIAAEAWSRIVSSSEAMQYLGNRT
jgi:hypothetical protein